MRKRYLLGRRFYDVVDTGGATPVVPPVTPVTPVTPPAGKTFTQEQVNAFLAKEKTATKAKMEELKTLNKQLKNSSDLTAQEVTALKSQIDEIETSYMSEAEKLKASASKKEKDLQAQIDALGQDGTAWKKRFLDAEIKKEILSNAGNAINPNQILRLISGEVKAEIGDDNAISLKIGDKGIKDYITDMEKDVENYGNLFKSKKTGLGLGGKTTKTMSGEMSMEDISKQLYGDK